MQTQYSLAHFHQCLSTCTLLSRAAFPFRTIQSVMILKFFHFYHRSFSLPVNVLFRTSVALAFVTAWVILLLRLDPKFVSHVNSDLLFSNDFEHAGLRKDGFPCTWLPRSDVCVLPRLSWSGPSIRSFFLLKPNCHFSPWSCMLNIKTDSFLVLMSRSISVRPIPTNWFWPSISSFWSILSSECL